MRELVLDKIDELRQYEGDFSAGTFRWGKYFLVPDKGVTWIHSRKEKNMTAPTAIHLNDTTREDFDALGDLELLESYTKILRQFCKQM